MNELGELEQKILQILKQRPEGFEDQHLAMRLKNISDSERTQAVNTLLTHRRITLLQTGRDSVAYKYQTELEAEKLKNLSHEETEVFLVIEDSGNKGIWTTEIKQKIHSIQNADHLKRVIDSLHKRKYIKKVKSIQQKNKFVWMLTEIEPCMEVTGGLIGQEDFDIDLIEVITEKIIEHVRKNGNSSFKELMVAVKQTGLIDQGKLNDSEIEQIIQVLEYDNKLEKVSGKDQNKIFKLCQQEYPNQLISSQIPCTHCPVKRECGPNNLINPKSCPYLKDWTQSF